MRKIDNADSDTEDDEATPRDRTTAGGVRTTPGMDPNAPPPRGSRIVRRGPGVDTQRAEATHNRRLSSNELDLKDIMKNHQAGMVASPVLAAVPSHRASISWNTKPATPVMNPNEMADPRMQGQAGSLIPQAGFGLSLQDDYDVVESPTTEDILNPNAVAAELANVLRERRRESMNEVLRQRSDKVKDLTSQLHAAESTLQQRNHRLSILETEVEQLREDPSMAGTPNNKDMIIESLKEQVRELEANVREKDIQIRELNDELISLATAHDQLEGNLATIRESPVVGGNIQQMTQDLSRKNMEVEILKSKLQQFETRKNSTTLIQLIEQKDKQLQEKSRQIAQLRNQAPKMGFPPAAPRSRRQLSVHSANTFTTQASDVESLMSVIEEKDGEINSLKVSKDSLERSLKLEMTADKSNSSKKLFDVIQTKNEEIMRLKNKIVRKETSTTLMQVLKNKDLELKRKTAKVQELMAAVTELEEHVQILEENRHNRGHSRVLSSSNGRSAFSNVQQHRPQNVSLGGMTDSLLRDAESAQTSSRIAELEQSVTVMSGKSNHLERMLEVKEVEQRDLIESQRQELQSRDRQIQELLSRVHDTSSAKLLQIITRKNREIDQMNRKLVSQQTRDKLQQAIVYQQSRIRELEKLLQPG